MFWTLVVLTTAGAPIPTGLVYDTLDACYAAEDAMAAEYTRYYNAHSKAGASAASMDLIRSRMLRGICVPHEPPNRSN